MRHFLGNGAVMKAVVGSENVYLVFRNSGEVEKTTAQGKSFAWPGGWETWLAECDDPPLSGEYAMAGSTTPARCRW